mmetsp:Transcript_10938/g.14764  ORF Transcript_10938/g.14764 Transcript_10938/m.14764 type:complete len:86 (+) Transcript_10938:1480-1737(+)|eukprot:CAMPEP_0185574668 /NCGR_PEP_ID=MMETSP0434-20130131/6075_1 /TAXON_ID=626734 ORGANISM="Favella taraikaensis, Strain Fe Narragansett Bay" /NCGR_SAMPLE_ID=MMETSP0434 /ASSEMBLY_ACC=CAM_ASM_000379 /LENGTH=85 /DNA_ID=CAMNT_0028191317 /DNA_START=1408 /DNA_END=1665 /DNA_ORIENTATION=+
MASDSDNMKGENNSLKKKVQSLQIDYEKLSKKVSTTQARSSGATNSGVEFDWHNQSVQSDFVHSSLKPGNKLDMRGGSFDYEDVV